MRKPRLVVQSARIDRYHFFPRRFPPRFLFFSVFLHPHVFFAVDSNRIAPVARFFYDATRKTRTNILSGRASLPDVTRDIRGITKRHFSNNEKEREGERRGTIISIRERLFRELSAAFSWKLIFFSTEQLCVIQLSFEICLALRKKF